MYIAAQAAIIAELKSSAGDHILYIIHKIKTIVHNAKV
jgi:hypothetical protein